MKEQVPFTPQMKTFLTRVRLNLNELVRVLSPKVLQYYIIHPQNIVNALRLGFDTALARDEVYARGVVEKYLWTIPTRESGSEEEILNARKLAIWIFRQSKGLMEEVVLHSPYDPDDRTREDMIVATIGLGFCNTLNSTSGVPIVNLPTILRGVGCSLYLSTGCGNGVCDFNLTFEPYDARKARRLKWVDAMAGIKTIETPKAGW